MIEVKIPSPGESISEVELSSWLVADGDLVHKDQELAEIESDKATLMLSAPDNGKISIDVEEGSTLAVGTVACRIDTSVEVEDEVKDDKEEEETKSMETSSPKAKETTKKETEEGEKEMPSEKSSQASPEKQTKEVAAKAEGQNKNVRMTPLAREKMKGAGLSVDDIVSGLKKLSASDVEAVVTSVSSSGQSFGNKEPDRTEQRKQMSRFRKKLSQRLVTVKNETAMLTTFNEVDMSAVINIRKKYQEKFIEKHGLKLGFMSFFMKASAIALKARPKVNSLIDDEEIVTPNYVDVSVAVQTPKGLMVPVIRNVDTLSLAAIEIQLKELAGKARSGKISLEEMSGGTFTITNGGIFGSMLSTPLINPPQSAILGMHNIIERPVAVDGNVMIRPIMYVALSYDHRLIDGKDSVGFLMDVKNMLENPDTMLYAGGDPANALLDI